VAGVPFPNSNSNSQNEAYIKHLLDKNHKANNICIFKRGLKPKQRVNKKLAKYQGALHVTLET